MKAEWRRLAPLGLYLSLVAGLVSIGLYIVQRQWNLYLQISLGFVVVGLALYALLDPAQVRAALTGRQARYGSNALILTLAFVGILVVINYLVHDNSKRWDLTENKENTLAPETLDVLEGLPQAVVAQAFFTSRISSERAQELLDQYAFSSKGKLRYEFIDPEREPVAAQQAGITRDGTIVFAMADRQEQVEFVSEQELTAALIRLMSSGEHVVYVLTGHGENSPDDTGNESFSKLKNKLEAKNYTVQTLNLLTTNRVPEDASVIIVAGPYKPLSEGEVSLLSTFLDGGHAMVVMEEPVPLTEFGEDPDPMADYLAQEWGIVLGQDLIVDLSSNQPMVAVANQYGDHPITQQMRGLVTLFPSSRSVVVENALESNVSQVELILTSDQSWAERDMASLATGAIGPDPGVDMLGPVPMAAVAEDFSTGARLVVFGDSEFATDGFFDAYGNSDMIINAVDWAAGEEELISLTPRDTTQRFLITPTTSTMGLILLGSVVVLPGLVVFAGIMVWIGRRRRG